MKKNLISLNVVAYNEEKKIRECMESAKGVVDEIKFLHDGKCTDKTLEIVREYTKKIYIRPRIGEAEPHRGFAMEKSEGEWILTLDADERLTDGIRKNIRQLVKKDVDGYKFRWAIYDKGKRITRGPLADNYRLCLFRKSKTTAPKRVHEWYHVNGNVEKSEYLLDHRQPYDNWTMRGFYRKTKRWVKNDARQRIESGSAEKPAIVYLFKGIIWFGLLFPYFFFLKKLFLNGSLGFRVSLQNALYNLFLYFLVFKYKVTGKLPNP